MIGDEGRDGARGGRGKTGMGLVVYFRLGETGRWTSSRQRRGGARQATGQEGAGQAVGRGEAVQDERWDKRWGRTIGHVPGTGRRGGTWNKRRTGWSGAGQAAERDERACGRVLGTGRQGGSGNDKIAFLANEN